MSTKPADVTPEVVGEFSRTTTVRLVGALLAFVVLANIVALLLLAWRPVNRGNWLVRAKWDLLDSAPAAETLVLGDSSCNQGVMPEVLDQRLGTRSLNLCTIGNVLAVNDAWMLEEYIAKHGAPKRVVIVHVYDMWTRDADYTFMRLVAKIPRSWGFWSDMHPPLALHVSDYEDLVSSKWLPLHSESASLMMWLQSPKDAMKTRFAVDDRGFMTVTEAAPKRVVDNMRKHLRELPDLAAVPTPMNRLALRRLDELARAHHIEMTLAMSPMYDALWSEPAMQRHVGELRAAIRQILGPTSPVRVLDGPPLTFPADRMENVDHVVGDAARVYTEWLADRAKR